MHIANNRCCFCCYHHKINLRTQSWILMWQQQQQQLSAELNLILWAVENLEITKFTKRGGGGEIKEEKRKRENLILLHTLDWLPLMQLPSIYRYRYTKKKLVLIWISRCTNTEKSSSWWGKNRLFGRCWFLRLDDPAYMLVVSSYDTSSDLITSIQSR